MPQIHAATVRYIQQVSNINIGAMVHFENGKLVRVDQLGSYFFLPCKSCAQLPANSPDSLALPHPGAQEKGEGGRRGEAIKKSPSSFLALRATGKEGEERDHTHTYGKQLSPPASNYPCAQNRKEGRDLLYYHSSPAQQYALATLLDGTLLVNFCRQTISRHHPVGKINSLILFNLKPFLVCLQG